MLSARLLVEKPFTIPHGNTFPSFHKVMVTLVKVWKNSTAVETRSVVISKTSNRVITILWKHGKSLLFLKYEINKTDELGVFMYLPNLSSSK